MKTRIISYIACAILSICNVWAQADPIMRISEARKTQLKERATEFVRSYYDLLSDLSSEEKNLIYEYGVEYMMDKVSTFCPEFSVGASKHSMGTRDQYSNAFYSFLTKQKGKTILFSPENLECSKDFYKPDDESCYGILTYTLKIQINNRVVSTNKCEAYVIFKDAYAKANLICQFYQIQPIYNKESTKEEEETLYFKPKKAVGRTTVKGSTPMTMEQEFQQAEEWYKNYEEEKSFPVFKKLAAKGHTEAMALYGNSLIYGHGCKADTLMGCSWVMEAANKKNARAINIVGQLYRNGIGRPTDKKKAVEYFKKAAKMGEPRAYRNLGFAYVNGEGVKQNLNQAIKWWEKGEKLGDGHSKLMLGHMVLTGNYKKWNRQTAERQMVIAGEMDSWCQYLLGLIYTSEVKFDKAKAFKYFKLAAERNVPEAQNEVAKCYQDGWGTSKDEAKAIEWYAKAANKGIAEAQHAMYLHLISSSNPISQEKYRIAHQWLDKAVEKGWTPAMLDKALNLSFSNRTYSEEKYREAFNLFNKVKEQHPQAWYYIGMCFYEAKGVKQDYTKAFGCFNKIPSLSQAQYMIGECFYYGRGTSQNYQTARQWYEKAAQSKDSKALYKIASMHYWGRGTAIDYNKAFEWYSKAAEQGDKEAMGQLGYMYHTGEGTPKNDNKAFEWYLKSANLGYRIAQYNLGVCYEVGQGVKKNSKEAWAWYLKSAMNNYPHAIYQVIQCLYYGYLGITKDLKAAGQWYARLANLAKTDTDAAKYKDELKKLQAQFSEIEL